MAIKSPPGLIPLSHLSGEELLAHLRFNRVTDEKGRYLPFDELQYRIKKGENVDVAWTLTRLARNAAIQRINYCNEAGEQAGFNITPVIAEACELVDKRATALALKDQTERLRGAGAELSQLRLEEPITSSQLEGANTTTLVARKMLETGRSPRTERRAYDCGKCPADGGNSALTRRTADTCAYSPVTCHWYGWNQ